MKRHLVAPIAIATAIVVLLAGCETSPESRELARTTDLQVTTLAADGRKLAGRETALVHARRLNAQNSAIASRTADADLRRVLQIASSRGSSTPGCAATCVGLYNSVLTRYEAAERVELERLEAAKAYEQKLSAQLKQLESTTQEASARLEVASRNASSLSEKLSSRELAEFLFRYGRQVQRSAEEGIEAAEAAKNKEAAIKPETN